MPRTIARLSRSTRRALTTAVVDSRTYIPLPGGHIASLRCDGGCAKPWVSTSSNWITSCRRNYLTGVDRRTRGVSRRVSTEAAVTIRLAWDLAAALEMPFAAALRISQLLQHERDGEPSMPSGSSRRSAQTWSRFEQRRSRDSMRPWSSWDGGGADARRAAARSDESNRSEMKGAPVGRPAFRTMCSRRPSQAPALLTFSAAGPLGPCTMSNSTASPSASVLNPLP